MKKLLLFILAIGLGVSVCDARIKDRNVDSAAGIKASKISGGTFGSGATEDAAGTTAYTFPGALTVTGNETLSANQFTTAKTVISVKVASVTFTPTGVFQLIGSTGAITLSATPTIATGTATNGQHLVLLSTAAVVTLQDQATLSNSALALSAATITVTTSTPVEFYYYNSKWYELK